MVPLSAFTHFGPSNTSLAVAHQGVWPSVTMSFNLAPGVSLGQATQVIETSERSIAFPATIHASFQGTAAAFQESLSNEPVLILTALAAVYIVLGILYESYIHPITILSTIPSAGVGALLALLITHNELNVIGLIGIILLIGLVKKNAIMMIDFALDAERREGKSRLGCDSRSLPASFPSHHDDHHGRIARRLAARPRHRHRLGIAPALGHDHCGRTDRQPGADSIHHARRLPVHGPARGNKPAALAGRCFTARTRHQPRGLIRRSLAQPLRSPDDRVLPPARKYSRVKLQSLPHMRHKIRQAVITGIEMIFVRNALRLKLPVEGPSALFEAIVIRLATIEVDREPAQLGWMLLGQNEGTVFSPVRDVDRISENRPQHAAQWRTGAHGLHPVPGANRHQGGTLRAHRRK